MEDNEKDITPKAEEQKRQGALRHRLWGSLFTEDESDAGEGRNLRDLVAGMDIDGRWFFRQVPLLLIILGGFLLIVTNRYQAQQEIIEKEQLQRDVEDWRFRALTRSSELTTKTRQSKIEERLEELGDSALKASNVPPFTLTPNE